MQKSPLNSLTNLRAFLSGGGVRRARWRCSRSARARLSAEAGGPRGGVSPPRPTLSGGGWGHRRGTRGVRHPQDAPGQEGGRDHEDAAPADSRDSAGGEAHTSQRRKRESWRREARPREHTVISVDAVIQSDSQFDRRTSRSPPPRSPLASSPQSQLSWKGGK
jgi:hypothetical protein